MMKKLLVFVCCFLSFACFGFGQITIKYPAIIPVNSAMQGTFTNEEKAVIAKAVEHWQAAFPCVVLELSFRGVKFVGVGNQNVILGAATVTEDSMGPVNTSGGTEYGDIPTTGSIYSGIPKKATIMLRRLKMNEPERFFVSEDPMCPFAHDEWIDDGKADFYSTVLHEIGHAMGLNNKSMKLMNMLDTTTMPHSIPCPPGDPAYLTNDKAHLTKNHHADDLMRTGGARLGERFFISELDQQLLKKIYGPTYKRGFEVELPPGATPPSTVNIIVRRAAH